MNQTFKIGFPYMIDDLKQPYIYLGEHCDIIWFCELSNKSDHFLSRFGYPLRVGKKYNIRPTFLEYDKVYITKLMSPSNNDYFNSRITFKNNQILEYYDTEGNWYNKDIMKSDIYVDLFDLDNVFKGAILTTYKEGKIISSNIV